MSIDLDKQYNKTEKTKNLFKDLQEISDKLSEFSYLSSNNKNMIFDFNDIQSIANEECLEIKKLYANILDKYFKNHNQNQFIINNLFDFFNASIQIGHDKKINPNYSMKNSIETNRKLLNKILDIYSYYFEFQSNMNNDNNILPEAKFWVTLMDGKTSYEISEEDYNELKKCLSGHYNANTPKTFDLGQKKHEKKENTWEIRTIIIANILSLNRHEPEKIEEPKNRGVIFCTHNKRSLLTSILENTTYVTEKDYQWLKENALKLDYADAGTHGIPSDICVGQCQIYLLDNFIR